MKYLLVYPDFKDDDAGRAHGGNYSEGLASISAVLKQAGHKVSLYHMTYMPGREEFVSRINAEKADIIGFSVRTTVFPHFKKLAKWTKEASTAMVLCGGYHPTIAPDEVISAEGVDVVCIGEGEYPLCDLGDSMDAGRDYYGIESLWFKRNGEIVKNPVRALIEDLDTLPLPDYELFDYKNLISSKLNSALVMVSRGCIFSCTYCGNSQFRNVYPNRNRYARFKSPEKAIELLKTVIQRYTFIKYINFRDAIINMYPDWFKKFIELYRKEIHLPFTCNLRFDILDEETVANLKAAGCYMIDVGLESGNEEIRHKYLQRHMSNQQMINAFKWFKKYGIPTLTYNIVGLPFETLHTALETIKINAELNADRMIANIFYPYPATRLADIAKEAGFIDSNANTTAKVVLKQPCFPEHEVLFVSYYFTMFVRFYKLSNKMPGILRKINVKMLDAMFTGKFVPRKLLVKVYECCQSFSKWLKSSIITHCPGIYLKLRNSRYKIKNDAGNATT